MDSNCFYYRLELEGVKFLWNRNSDRQNRDGPVHDNKSKTNSCCFELITSVASVVRQFQLKKGNQVIPTVAKGLERCQTWALHGLAIIQKGNAVFFWHTWGIFCTCCAESLAQPSFTARQNRNWKAPTPSTCLEVIWSPNSNHKIVLCGYVPNWELH